MLLTNVALLLFSYWLYSISHPNKVGYPLFDLSGDSEATVENMLLTPKELAVEKVITKVFVKLRSNVIVMNRLRSVFMSKLSRMGKHLSLCGGRKRSEILDKWKDMNWLLTLNENEIVPSCKKDSAIVLTVKSKCDELKEELKDVSKKLKDMTNKCSDLDASNKQLLAYRSGASIKRK